MVGSLLAGVCELYVCIHAGGPAGRELAGAEAFNRTRFPQPFLLLHIFSINSYENSNNS